MDKTKEELKVKEGIELFTFCQSFPKIDLHAHLNGSIRKSTLFELSNEENRDSLSELYAKKMNFGVAFQIFKISSQILTELSIVRRITREMIEDWEKHNCIYLEIRTSLKSINGESKSEYLKVVLEEINVANSKYTLQTRLIVSLNREYPVEEYLEIFNVIKEFKTTNEELSELIVGIDYCGNENVEKHEMKDIKNIFHKFKDEFNYKLTYHLAEIKNYKKIDFKKDFKPERISHCNFLSVEDQNDLIKNMIPLEVCPTSSYACKEVNSYKEINLFDYHNKTVKLDCGSDYMFDKFCINTDDTMLFNTDISQEYYEVAINFNLKMNDLLKIVLNTIDFIFEDNEEFKENLRKKIKNWK